MPGEKQQTGVSRRTLVKSAALGSLALAAGGVSLPFGMRTAAAAVQQAMRNEEDKIVWGACSVNCGSRCALPPWQKGILNIQIWGKSKKSKPPAPGRFYAPGAPRFANTTTFKTLFWMSIVSCYENHQP